MGVSISDGLTLLNTDEDITWTGQQTFNDDIVMASGKGIDFSATADGSGTTTSEVFSDYEEGTFTPVLTDGSSPDAVYATQVGRYTMMGNRVIGQIRMTLTSLGTLSGGLSITGLPFTSSSASGSQNAAWIGFANNLSITASESLTGSISSNSTSILLNIWNATTGTAAYAAAEATATFDIIMNFSYEAA